LDIAEAKERVKLQIKVQKQQSARLAVKELEIARLKTRSEQLYLAITALSRFLIVKGLVSEEELAAFIAELDASDGNADGRLDFGDELPRPRLLFPKK